MGIDPVTSISEAVKEIAKVIYLSFNGKNRQMLLNVKRQKHMQKVIDYADEFMLHGHVIDDVAKIKYLKLRGKI